MMLIKLVECAVFENDRSQFANGQLSWRALQSCAGFLAQFGGWSVDEPNLAVIVGVWRDDAAYEHFMKHVHDAIFDSNGQRGTYDPGRSSMSLWKAVDECLPILRRIMSGRDEPREMAYARIGVQKSIEWPELPVSFRVIHARPCFSAASGGRLVLGFASTTGFEDQTPEGIGYTRVRVEQAWSVVGPVLVDG